MANVAEILTLSNNVHTEGIFVVSNPVLQPFKDIAKGNYLNFTIRDKTGQVPVKMWSNADKYMEVLKSGKVFHVIGKINKYQGANQLVVSSVEKTENYKSIDFLPVSERDPDKMWDSLVTILDRYIIDEDIKKLWIKYRDNKNFVERFKLCPGGKGPVHHAYLHGLLEHTFDVIQHCASYCEIYEIDSSIICMGAFLHDVGKMFAYKYDLSIEMTDLGRLQSHLNLSYTSAVSILDALEITKEKRSYLKMILGHLILSHHGTLEYGSAVLPQTPEAILLSKADIIDSEFNQSKMFIKKINDGNWSTYDQLKGKFYYKDA